MPIDYSKYHPKWTLISKLIRRNRAGNKCEWCGVPNGAVIRWENNGKWTTPSYQEWDMIRSKQNSGYSFSQAIKMHGYTKIVLTVAHLDQDKNNNRFWNLAALCQREHLQHDMQQHIANRKYGRNWKGEHQLKMDL